MLCTPGPMLKNTNAYFKNESWESWARSNISCDQIRHYASMRSLRAVTKFGVKKNKSGTWFRGQTSCLSHMKSFCSLIWKWVWYIEFIWRAECEINTRSKESKWFTSFRGHKNMCSPIVDAVRKIALPKWIKCNQKNALPKRKLQVTPQSFYSYWLNIIATFYYLPVRDTTYNINILSRYFVANRILIMQTETSNQPN